MSDEDSIISIIDSIISEGVEKGIIQLTTTDVTGRKVTINGKSLINFGSCSYLGLEMDPRLRKGVIEAVEQFGTQFSASRAYLSAPPYLKLQHLLAELFGAYPLISASTTLGHLSAIPVLIGPDDALILDRQVHNSVQLATTQCQIKGSTIKIIHHNELDLLEETINELGGKGAKHIWYFADGVYSMYGDLAPVDDIIALLNKHDNFYLYIDDAHGMSWYGNNGRGTVLGFREIHPKMVVAVSLNKAFAAAGGAIIFPNAEYLRKVMNCGGTFIFSGPIQPPMLGACIASAEIHLSGQIHPLQKELHDKILYCNEIIKEHHLPLLSDELSPIRFIGIGSKSITINLIKRLMQEGYYTCLATFPAVSMKRSGIRITINRHLTKEDIKGLVTAIHHHLPLLLAEEKYELDFEKTFGTAIPKKVKPHKLSVNQQASAASEFNLTYETTINNINKQEWDWHLKNRGPFSWDELQFLENLFSDPNQPENDWKFHYFIIRDQHNQIVLMTFFVTLLSKDDIFSPAAISEKIEAERETQHNPYYFTSKVLMMGSLFSEGNHLYLDRSKNWQAALKLLLKQLSLIEEKNKVEMILLRDLPADDQEMHDFMLEQGYFKASLPDAHVLHNTTNDFSAMLKSLSSRYRSFVKKQILKREQLYEVEILSNQSRQPSPQEFEQFYQLYKNVKKHSFEINVFDLPKNIFENMLKTNIWEIILLYLKEEVTGQKKLVAVAACMKTPETYCPMLIGLDYDYVVSHGVYRQMLYRAVKRGFDLHEKEIFLGLTTSLQKQRIGAIPHKIVAYVQMNDTYKMEVLSQMIVEK